MSFEQYATGVMSLEVLGNFHCGPDKQSPRDFTWEVQVSYGDGSLDEYGFLLDNLIFEEFFNGIRRTELSCERLMEECCKKLWAMAGGRAEELRTTIWAIPGKVRVTRVMRRGEGG